MTKQKVIKPMSTKYYIKTILLEHYIGMVNYYDGDQFLYSEYTKIHRRRKEDAEYDATRLAEDHFATFTS